MECPVCTLILKPGMSLEAHLETHPVQRVIEVLAAATMHSPKEVKKEESASQPAPGPSKIVNQIEETSAPQSAPGPSKVVKQDKEESGPQPAPRLSKTATKNEEENAAPSLTKSVYPHSNRYCFYCGKHGHTVNYCVEFNNLTPRARRNHAMKTGRCFNCLAWDHKMSHCRSTNRCKECGEQHHTLLHQ